MPEEIFETSQPTQLTEPTVEPKPINWLKIILATVLGFGLLAGSAYAGYYYGTQQVQQIEKPTALSQPTPTSEPTPTSTLTPSVEDKTAGWKNYTNTTLGYQLKYPLSYKLNERWSTCIEIVRELGGGKPVRISIGKSEVGQFCFPTGFGVIDKTEDLDTFRLSLGEDNYVFRDVRLVSGSNDDVLGVKPENLTWVEIRTGKKGSFSILYIIPFEIYQEEVETVRNILSTFKFLEVEDQTQNWKVYRNEKYNYTVKYPSDFYVVGPSDSQSASFGPTQYREVIKSYHAVMGIDSTLTTLSPQQFLDKYGNTNTFSDLREIKNMTIDGSQAIQFTATNKQTGIVATHTLVNAKDGSGELLIIEKFYVGKDKGEVSDEIYSQILSTLSFFE